MERCWPTPAEETDSQLHAVMWRTVAASTGSCSADSLRGRGNGAELINKQGARPATP